MANVTLKFSPPHGSSDPTAKPWEFKTAPNPAKSQRPHSGIPNLWGLRNLPEVPGPHSCKGLDFPTPLGVLVQGHIHTLSSQHAGRGLPLDSRLFRPWSYLRLSSSGDITLPLPILLSPVPPSDLLKQHFKVAGKCLCLFPPLLPCNSLQNGASAKGRRPGISRIKFYLFDLASRSPSCGHSLCAR